jgi:hypothetical protein
MTGGANMSELIQSKDDYVKARYEVFGLASTAVSHLIGFLDYYREQMENEPQGLNEFMKAHDFWLIQKFVETGGSKQHSLASLWHYEHLQNVLMEMFERFVPEVETFAERTHDVISAGESITRNRQNAATLRSAIAEFNTTYAAEIAADEASDACKADRVLIAKCVADLHLATLGKWTPDFVYVNSLGRDLETPGSAALSKIAELARAGGLRLPRTLLSVEGT